MKELEISFREKMLYLLDKLIESCNKCCDSALEIKVTAQ